MPGEAELLGYGVSTCATCDGFFFRDHDIAVVGGGDSAIEEAIFLTKFADQVTIVHRRDELRASKIMQDRALANPKIEFRWNTVVTEVVGRRQGRPASTSRTSSPASGRSLDVTGLFVAIGHQPNTDLFKGQLDMEDNGYLITAAGQHPHQRRGRLRLRRRAGPHLPPGRSPPPAPAAWPPSTSSAGSSRSTDDVCSPTECERRRRRCDQHDPEHEKDTPWPGITP